MEKTYRISMDANLWAYAQKVGNGSINAGVTKIISQYKAEDPDYFTPEVAVAEAINDATPATQGNLILSNDIAAKLAAINEATDKAAVEEGRIMTEEEGKATLYELSAYNYVIQGDTRPEPIRSYLKSLEADFQRTCKKLKGAAVWRIPKAKLTDIDAFVAAMAEIGLAVTIGESLMTEEERAAASEKAEKSADTPKKKSEKPAAGKVVKLKADAPAKKAAETPAETPVISIAPVTGKCLCFENKKDAEDGYVSVERELVSRDKFYYYQGTKGAIIYVKVGNSNEQEADVFCAIAKVKGQMTDLKDGAETKAWSKIAELGLVAAVKKNLTAATIAMSYALAEVGAIQADIDYIYDKVA